MIKANQRIRINGSAGSLRATATNPIPHQRRSVAQAAFGKDMQTEQAMFGGGSMFGAARNGVTTNYLPQSGILYDTMLNNLIGENEMTNVRFYRDIYHYDAVAGSMVDLMSNMPFSDFQLLGCSDERLETYDRAIARLDFKTYLPEATVDYLVTGMNISTLVYNSQQKAFVDYIPWRMEDCRIHHTPMRNVDPIIEARPPDYYREFMRNDRTEFRKIRADLNSKMVEAFTSEMITLDPLNTIYLPRRTYTYSQHGTSIYRRILPLYFLEKTLYRGTLVEAMRRQRALLHLQMGDDIWEPSPEEMQAIVAMFMEADMDPLGAVVGTRQGVQPSELRQGGDFWKYLDIIDATSALKMRALGIGESFLSSDATYASQEVGLTVFTENIRGFREHITWRIFMTKLFPLIASLNGFLKEDGKKSTGIQSKAEHASAGKFNIALQHKINDSYKYDLPTLHWSKPLRPAADQQTLDMLGTLKDKGLPIPLTMFAAAGGLNMDNLIRDLREDEEVKKKIKKITGKTPEEIAQESMGLGAGGMGGFGDTGMGGAGDNGMSDSRSDRLAEESLLRTLLHRRKVPMLSREFETEYSGQTRTGQKRHIFRQNIERDRQYDQLAKAIKSVSDPHRYSTVVADAAKRMGGLPDLYGPPGPSIDPRPLRY